MIPPRNNARPARRRPVTCPTEESPWVRWTLIAVSLGFLLVFLLLPMANVFAQAFGKGLGAYWQSLAQPESRSAIRLTLIVAAITVP
jgi:sulfate transport system permease protein